MCGIIGSFDSAVVLDGVEACKSRGDEAASLTVIDTSGEITSIYKRVYPGSSTKVKTWLSDVPTGSYMLVHLQAPTNTSTPGISRVHPASEGADLLWHNGIIKNVVGWDTKCLLHKIRQKELDLVSGSFACVLKAGYRWSIFRNNLCPLFLDQKLNICSVKLTEQQELIEPLIAYRLNFEYCTAVKAGRFLSKGNDIYYTPEKQ